MLTLGNGVVGQQALGALQLAPCLFRALAAAASSLATSLW